MPKTRDECEIAGYRDVLHMIHESYEHIPVKSAFILQLHRSLYKFEDIGTFHPVAAWETSESVERLCAAYENAVNRTNADHLLLIPMFILDFLCIVDAMDGLYAQMDQLKESDVRGDVYEYLLSKLSTAGVNGQFRTPRHIIRMMVIWTEPCFASEP